MPSTATLLQSVCLALVFLLKSSAAGEDRSANAIARGKEGVEAFGHTWLQDADPSSYVAKSRARRFASFPTGSKLQMEFTLTIPTPGLSDSGSLSLVSVHTFNLPNDTITLARNYPNIEPSDRSAVYGRMESFLEDFGYDGHACTLRTLCEIAESPFDHGVYGEVLNLVLSASVTPEQNSIYDEYMTAEYYGSTYGDCGSIYSSCPHSVLNVVSKMI